MPRYRFWNRDFEGEAKRLLRQRLLRQEMGDEAYERMIAGNGEAAFRKFGIVFIIAFAAIVLAIAVMGW